MLLLPICITKVTLAFFNQYRFFDRISWKWLIIKILVYYFSVLLTPICITKVTLVFFFNPYRHEDHFLISGLTRAPAGLSTTEWQDRVKKDVGGVISILLDRECPVQVVFNQTGQRANTSYMVKMRNLQDAKDIKAKFGSFFAGGRDDRPEALKGVSISNWTTPATKVRLAILKVLAARYRNANKGSRVKVRYCSFTSSLVHLLTFFY